FYVILRADMGPQSKTINGGLVIIFEGIDGAGKTTQLHQAEQVLKNDGWLVVTRRNPGGTAIGEELRTTMMRPVPRPAMTDLYISAAVQEALIEEVDLQRSKGAIILMDRSPISIASYQIYGSGINPDIGWHFVDDGMNRIKPNLTLIFQCDYKVALDRARQIANQFDYFESKPDSYFEKVVSGYSAAAEKYHATIIDSNLSIEQVHEQTMLLISKLIPPQTPTPTV
ncbi:MAG: dTMP kinase, partial [Candidatus Saccharimonadales bacterium]